MKCCVCGRDVEQKVKGPARKTCSARCRKRLSRARQAQPIPAELTARRAWVRAIGKRPVMPDGSPASSTDSSTWSEFDAVQSGAGDGFGIMLGGGIGCYDIDNALDGGVLKPWARQIVESISEPVLYTELSVSGRGVHVFVVASEDRGSRRPVGDGFVEKYSRARFIRCGTPFDVRM